MSIRSVVRFIERVRRLDPVNERSFVNLFDVFLLSDLFRDFSDRDFRSDFRTSITFRSFIGIRRFKRLEFRLEILFPFNQLKQVFCFCKI